jgi:hypothetical protein
LSRSECIRTSYLFPIKILQLSNSTVIVTYCRLQVISLSREHLNGLHKTFLRQHELVRELEMRHLAELKRLRAEQMREQHQAELSNQREYTERLLNEQRVRHAAEAKQVPKDAKVSFLLLR